MADVAPLRKQDPNLPPSSSTTKSLLPHARDGSPVSLPAVSTSIVQGMLKTTTELGDRGQFASRPSRIPRPTSQILSPRLRSRSVDAPHASLMRHYHPIRDPRHRRRRHDHVPGQSLNVLSANNSMGQIASQHSRVSHRSRHRRPVPPDTLRGPAPGPPHLYSQRSLMTFRSHRELHSMHSSSSMRQDLTRRHRQPTRGAPGMSGAHSYHYALANGAGGTGTVESSPASMLHPRSMYPGQHSDMNSSFSSLSRMPSPAMSAGYLQRGRSFYGPYVSTSRTGTPGFGVYPHPRTASRNSAVSQAAFARSPTMSTAQHYYDYTESFIEEDSLLPASILLRKPSAFLMTDIVAQDAVPERRLAQSPFGNILGSSARPIELPTEYNRRASHQSARSSMHSPPPEIPPRSSSIGAVLRLSATEPRRNKAMSISSEAARISVIPNGLTRHSSLTSRRNSANSTLSAFFQNATRSPRDLATLAARVHSPVSELQLRKEEDSRDPAGIEETNAIQPSCSPLPQCKQDPAKDTTNDTTNRNAKLAHISSWQVSTIAFRQSPFQPSSRSVERRPYTSSGAPSHSSIQVLSPTPERPMSSQSRKQFSRILDIQDDSDERVTAASASPFVTSYLDKVDEVVNPMSCPAMSYTPRSLMENLHAPSLAVQNTTADSVTEERSDCDADADKSTVESLLDEHIECLGLQTESESSDFETANEEDLTSSHEESEKTIKYTNISCLEPPLRLRRAATSSSCKHSSLATTERQRLTPRRLFASLDMGDRSNVVWQMSLADPKAPLRTSQEPSSGWQTLGSESHTFSVQSLSKPSIGSGELADVDSSSQMPKFRLRRRSDLSLTLSEALDEHAENLTQGNDQTLGSHYRSSSDVLRTRVSYSRQKLKIRLKTERRSYSHGDLAGLDGSTTNIRAVAQHLEGDATSDIKSDMPEEPAEVNGEACDPHQQQSVQALPNGVREAFSPTWSSIMAVMPDPTKKGTEIQRRPTVRTQRSNRSIRSVVSPLNSTHAGIAHLRLGKDVPRLSPPNFSTNLTKADLALNMPGAEPSRSTKPISPAEWHQRSFFSDNKPHFQSLRKVLKLDSFRSLLHGSPGMTVIATETSQHVGRDVMPPSQSCRMDHRGSAEGPIAVPNDTVAMSDFAYHRKKVFGRIRGWWKRQCMQKAFNTKRQKAAGVPGGLLV